jgi:ectoine hydroxylase-related dioxygenase (phytanoyl-CoA dioxygenase family)
MDTWYSTVCSSKERSQRSVPMSNGSSRSTHLTSVEIPPSNRPHFATRCSIAATSCNAPSATLGSSRPVEPLLGEDCHVIANTAWRQGPGENDHLGRFWHIDAGPHVPRDPSVPWDARIPYPVFAIAAHLYLRDCPIEAGPTGLIPGSHTSGQAPPMERLADDDLEWNGQGIVPIVARAGDVALFVLGHMASTDATWAR